MAELDKLRTELMNASAIRIQRHMRGFLARAYYQRKRAAVVVLQVGCLLLTDPQPCACLTAGTTAWLKTRV